MTIAVPLPTPPFTVPVLITALAMVVFLVVPLLFERFGEPSLSGGPDAAVPPSLDKNAGR